MVGYGGSYTVIVPHAVHLWTVKFFSKLNNLFFGYVDPINIFFDHKNK